MKRIIIELSEEDYHMLEQAEKRNELVKIKEFLQEAQTQGKVNIVNV